MGIGLVMALPPLFKVVAPWLWGRWADRSGRRRPLLIIACLAAAVALAAMTIPAPLPMLCLLVGLYGFARAPIIPYLEATTLEQAESRGFAYGPVRLWGSVSFMLTSSVFGAIRGPVSDDTGLLFAAALLGVCAMMAVHAFPAPTRPWADPTSAASSGGAEYRVSRRSDTGLVRLLLVCAMMQVSHGAYYAFYSIHLAQLGYRSASIGALWALGVLCEILLLSRADALLRRFGSRTMMTVCLLLAAVRWLLIGTADDAVLLVIGQVLHAATYAGFHVAAVREVYRRYGSARRASGQAMYSGMTFGLGMFVGSLAAGALARTVGLPAAFVASAFVALAAVPLLPKTVSPGGVR